MQLERWIGRGWDQKARVILRVLGYGSTLFVLVMMQLPLRTHSGYGVLTSIVAGMPVLVGPVSLVLLISQPEVSRRERWLACVLLWVLLLAMLLRALGKD